MSEDYKLPLRDRDWFRNTVYGLSTAYAIGVILLALRGLKEITGGGETGATIAIGAFIAGIVIVETFRMVAKATRDNP